MKFDIATIQRAFGHHYSRYATGKAAWEIPHHIRCWHLAKRAFGESSFEEFDKLYEILRRQWHVFRGRGVTHWSSREVFGCLAGLDQKARFTGLSELTPGVEHNIRGILEAMSGVKHSASGASVTAVSKFLHFWNPRLFVIVDRQAMWQGVFSHPWPRDGFRATRKEVVRRLGNGWASGTGSGCNLVDYLSILHWGASVSLENREITSEFCKYVATNAGGVIPPEDLRTYEAPALEWFLLGHVDPEKERDGPSP